MSTNTHGTHNKLAHPQKQHVWTPSHAAHWRAKKQQQKTYGFSGAKPAEFAVTCGQLGNVDPNINQPQFVNRGKPRKSNVDPKMNKPQFIHKGVPGLSEASNHFWRGPLIPPINTPGLIDSSGVDIKTTVWFEALGDKTSP